MLLAASEICGVPVAVLLFVAWWAWYNYQREQAKTYTKVTWSGSMYATLDISSFQDIAHEFFCSYHQCSQSRRTATSQVFARGNQGIKKLPQVRDVYWNEVPVTISLTYSRNGIRTDVSLGFAAPEDMTFNEESASFFHKQAKEEYDDFFDAVKKTLQPNQQEQQRVFSSVGWSKQRTFHLPCDVLKAIVEKLQCGMCECSLDDEDDTYQTFSRGDSAIDRLPMPRDVGWLEVPVTIHLKYREVSEDKTTIKAAYTAPKNMQFDETCRAFFLEQAEFEFVHLCTAVEKLRERFEECVSDQQEAEDVERSDDYETLGLNPGASWEQVKAAYRDMTLKYHPDTLSGRDVPDHIKTLAVEKFKRVTEAYQRLRDRLSSAG